MKAVQISQFGSVDVLSVVELEIPKPKENELLIKVKAAGINPVDCKIRRGLHHSAKKFKDKFPIGLGFEMSGQVVTAGSISKEFIPGERVCGFVGHRDNPRCYAEYVVTIDEKLIQVPEGISDEEAAALPLAGLTALQALRLAKIGAGDRVLIHAGAGGVGHLAIQLVKLMGAYVITTASPANHAFLFELGADECIDYHQQDFVKVVKQVDKVIDLVGSEVGLRSLEVVALHGKLITVPSATAEQIIKVAESKKIDAQGISMDSNKKDLTYLMGLMAQKKLKVFVSRTFPIDEVKAAQQLIESGKTKGKIALVFKWYNF